MFRKKTFPVGKSLVASTLAVCLVLGGSTYALWNANVSPDSSAAIQVGGLEVIAAETSPWFDIRDEANPIQVVIDEYRMVPADKLRLTQTMKVVITGEHTSGRLTVKVPNNTQDRSILEQAKFTLVLKDSEGNVLKSETAQQNTADSFSITVDNLKPTDATGDDYSADVIVELPPGANNETQLSAAILGQMVIILEQGPAYVAPGEETPVVPIEPEDIPPLQEDEPVNIDLGLPGEDASYEVVEGELPPGVTLDPDSGVISGTPTTAGNYPVVIEKTTPSGSTTHEVVIEVKIAAPTITRTSMPSLTQDVTTTIGFGGSGKNVTFSVVAGSIPEGMKLDQSNGNLSGAPTVVGDYSFTLRKENAGGFVERTYSGTVLLDSPGITVYTVPYSVIGEPYSYTIPGKGREATFSSTELPPGLTLDPATGIISGVPTTVGSYSFSVTKTNAAGTVTRSLSHTVRSTVPEWITEEIPPMQVGVPYSYFLEAYGYNVEYANVETLPSGMRLDKTTGEIYGTPTNSNTGSTIRFRATTNGGNAYQYIKVVVLPDPPVLVEQTLPQATQLLNYKAEIQGSGQQSSFKVIEGALPPGLSITGNPTNGLPYIGGSPNSNAYGTYEFTIERTNVSGTTTQRYSIHVAYQVPTITTSSLPNAVYGKSYSEPITGVGNGSTYSIDGEILPGLSIDSATGRISGTPTATGSYTFKVVKTNSSGTATREYTILSQYAAPVMPSASGMTFTVDATNQWSLPATGDAMTFSQESEGIPGMTLNTATGVYSGIPTASGTFTVTFRVRNDGGSVTRAYTFLVKEQAPKEFLTLELPNGQVGEPYSAVVKVEGKAIEYSVVSGGLPAGLSLNKSTGEISGTPTASTITPRAVNIRATNNGGYITMMYYIDILPAVPTITTESLPDASYGVSYSSSIAGTGTETSYSIESGELPTGLKMSIAGNISGSASVVGTYEFTVVRSNRAGEAKKTFTIVVKDVPPTITTTSVPDRKLGTTFNTYIYGGGTNAIMEVTAGALPPGVNLQVTNNIWHLYGAPTELGDYSFTLTKSNSAGSVSQDYNIKITHVAPTITGTLSTANVGTPYVQLFEGTGLDVTYDISGLPEWASFNYETGEISGTPTEEGSYPVTMTKSNNGGTATRSFTLTVKMALPVVINTVLPPATVGQPYDSGIFVSGEDMTFATVSGMGFPPSGLTYDKSTGRLTGTPNNLNIGNNSFTFRITNPGGSVQHRFTIQVIKP